MDDFTGYHGEHQPPGYVTPKEANHEALKKAQKTDKSGRTQPREFFHQLRVPYFMDRRMIADTMEERGCSQDEAVEILTALWLEEDRQ